MTFHDIIFNNSKIRKSNNKMQISRLNNYSSYKYMFSENRTNDNQLVKRE